ncbi:MAG: GyrI-like domain-containing protein [Planctomycetota bacterium JB042]
MTHPLAVPLLLAAAFGAGEDASPLLDRVERAGGDPAARDPLPSLVLRGTASAEGLFRAAKVEEIHLGADRALTWYEYPGIGRAVIGRVGDVCYSADPAVGVDVREGEEAASVRRMLMIFRRAPWRSIYGGAELAGKEAVDGTELTKVRMLVRSATADSSGDSGDTWWIDESAARLVHVDLRLPDPQGGELECRYSFGDWKEVDGIRFPARRTQRVGTYRIETTFTTIEPGAEVAAEDVLPPDDVARAIADPARRATKARDAGQFTVEEVAERPVLSIRTTIRSAEVSRNLAVLLPEVLRAVSTSGGAMAGPPFSRYHDYAGGNETLDLEAGIPLRAAVEAPDGRVTASTLPAGRAATGWHVGPYQELPRTYERLRKWMEAERLEPAGGPWEIYWTDPGLEPDPKKWRTQVYWPVK